jgi:hypothetical protein
MKNSNWRWTTLMGIGVFCGMLLSIGAGPAALGLNINTQNTFAVSFPDQQYDYLSFDKDKIIRGLVDWLSTKASPTSLKQIIIAGHSRGGCLTLGLIREFRTRPAFNQVRILGALVDGMCKDDGEMGTWSTSITNSDLPDVPVLPSAPRAIARYGWNSSFSTGYNNASVCIQNTVGGQPYGSELDLHSFFMTNPSWHNKWI